MSVEYKCSRSSLANSAPVFGNQEDPHLDYLDRLVWGARGISSVVNKPIKAVQQMLCRRQLDADKYRGQGEDQARSMGRRLQKGTQGEKVGASAAGGCR
jgi:hypothetical protein